MRRKFLIVTIISLILITVLQISSFAVIDQAKLFIATDCNNTLARQTTNYAIKTFEKLGYNVLGLSITGRKSDVLNYISGTGNNYGFYEYGHGGTGVFTMKNGDKNQYIYPSDITGYWHFVFLNSCSCLSNDAFGQAFRTVGYSNRAILGWYQTVTFGASDEWWSYFKNVAGTTNIRSACLAAADKCSNSTPIRIYGDKTWNGKAWDK